MVVILEFVNLLFLGTAVLELFCSRSPLDAKKNLQSFKNQKYLILKCFSDNTYVLTKITYEFDFILMCPRST